MPQSPAIIRAIEENVRREIARTREIIDNGLELLRRSRTDTFLGRSHRTPIAPNTELEE